MRRLALAFWIMALVPVLGFADARAADKDDKKAETKPTVAVFRLNRELTEAPSEEGLFLGQTPLSLKDVIARLKKAKDDPAVKAVVLFLESGVGSAQTEEIRQAMTGIRGAGKDVYVHADSLSTKDYVLLSGASRISVVPTGDLWVTGLYGESPYIRGLLDKLGVQPDFLHCGAYKSASEMFMREGPSKEAEEMQNWLLDSMYSTFVDLIAKGRKVEPSKVKEWIDNGPYTAEKAVKAGLIDAVEYREDFEKMLKDKYGKDVTFAHKYGGKKAPNADLSSPFGFLNLWSEMLKEGQKKKTGKDAIAIVYVEGPIALGGGSSSPFEDRGAFSTKIRKALDDAARDDSIKAVVLRVNSPGGSATASEIIYAATKRVKAKKPFIVSMGDVAASGGYYVGCASDTVFADKATITGSIGVVGGKLATSGMWKKIGITFKAYQRGKNAAMLSSAQVFSPAEHERMQAWMDEIYGVFKGHVVAIRGKKLKKPIDDLAGGRVYTGQQALELGLVDKIGSLEDTIQFVAKEANLKDYDVRVVPEPKNFLEQLIEEASGGKDEPHRLMANSQGMNLLEMALPYLKHLDPERVASVTRALFQLQTLQREGVALVMPEIRIGR